MNIDNSNIKTFDPRGEESEIAQKWGRWLRSFEIFLEAGAIQSDKQKRALLLHLAGENVQEVWFTLSESKQENIPGEDIYTICKKALTKVFQPKKSYTYERYIFRLLTQKEDETIIQFVTRLKEQSLNCNFKNYEDDMIIDQLIEKCKSNELRKQLLKVGDNITVEKAKEVGRIFEASEMQAGSIEDDKITVGKEIGGIFEASEMQAGSIEGDNITIETAKEEGRIFEASEMQAGSIEDDKITVGKEIGRIFEASEMQAGSIEGDNITVETAKEVGRIFEASEMQAGSIEGDNITVEKAKEIGGIFEASEMQAGSIAGDNITVETAKEVGRIFEALELQADSTEGDNITVETAKEVGRIFEALELQADSREGNNITVETAKEIGRIFEASEMKTGSIEAMKKDENIRLKNKTYNRPVDKKITCYYCDSDGHCKKNLENLSDSKIVLKDNNNRLRLNPCSFLLNRQGSLPKRNSQQGKDGIKSGKPNTIHDKLTFRENVKLRETENPWRPTRLNPAEAKSEEEIRTAELFRKVRCVLNKLSPENFEKLLNQVRALPIDNEERLLDVVDLIFEKAVKEPIFTVEYALMCKEIALMQVPANVKCNNKEKQQFVNFRKLLITRCQIEFENIFSNEKARNLIIKEIEEYADPELKKKLQAVRFIGELFKQQMITVKIMLICINILLENKNEDSLECLCTLLTTIGKELELNKNQNLNTCFNIMQAIVDKKKISNRVRFILQDVIDLRNSKWVPKNKD